MKLTLSKSILILWSIVYTLIISFVFITENMQYAVKSLYIFSLIATFPTGIMGAYIIDYLGGTNFLGITIIFYLLGVFQWVFGSRILVSLFRRLRR